MPKYEKPRLMKMSAIDFKKWNKCLFNSANEIVYAYSWFLNAVNLSWEALVYGDYEIVMPLNARKKFGISYLLPIPFSHQLGIFSQGIINSEIVELFISSIPSKYKYIDINLNKYNNIDGIKKSKITPKYSYALDLIEDYDTISSRYTPANKEFLEMAEEQELTLNENVSPYDFVQFILKKHTEIAITSEYLYILSKILTAAMHYKSGHLCCVNDKSNNPILAVLFLRSAHAICLTLPVFSSEADKQVAAHFLIDKMVKKFAYKNFTLDFGNLNNTTQSCLCENFGAKKYTYNNLKINRLPVPTKMLQKLKFLHNPTDN